MYLLGMAEARERIHGAPEFVSKSAITISLDEGDHVVSGVYMPPSMNPDDVRIILDRLSATSSVVLGDINTRFRDKTYQQGAPGPPDRLLVFSNFLSQQLREPFFHVKPQQQSPKPERFRTQLTTDHCFLKRRHLQSHTLHLLDNQNHTHIQTDHLYTLYLVLETGRLKRKASHTGIDDNDDNTVNDHQDNKIRRYKVSRLVMDDVRIGIT